MDLELMIVVVAAVGLVGVLVWSVSALRAKRGPVSSALREAARAARWRAFVGILVGLVVLLLVVRASRFTATLVDTDVFFALPLAAAAGFAVYAVLPPLRMAHDDQPRRALLVRRGPLSALPTRALRLLGAVLIAAIAAIVLGGLTADTQLGLSFGIRLSPDGELAPYTGWTQGLPLLAAFGLVALTALAAMSRIAAAPAIQAGDGEDAVWRRASAEVVATAASAAVLVPLGGVVIRSGYSVVHLARVEDASIAIHVAGWTGFLLGCAFVVVGVLLATCAVLWSAALPARVARVGALGAAA